jgi:hypothetical protein
MGTGVGADHAVALQASRQNVKKEIRPDLLRSRGELVALLERVVCINRSKSEWVNFYE